MSYPAPIYEKIEAGYFTALSQFFSQQLAISNLSADEAGCQLPNLLLEIMNILISPAPQRSVKITWYLVSIFKVLSSAEMLRNNLLFVSISAQENKSRFGQSGFESIKTQGKDHPLLFLEFLIVILIKSP